MYTSVLERTREVGVMKAIGAKNSDIMWIFLIESGLLGLVGGIIGVILGFSIAKFVEYIATTKMGINLLKISFSIPIAFACIFFSALVGAGSGVFPAISAGKTKVVDALRYE
jgi:putative ABC transport system permease protein